MFVLRALLATLLLARFAVAQETGKAMKKYKFKAKNEAGDGGELMCFFRTIREGIRHQRKVPVKATFDGVPYTGSLIKYGHPLHSWVCLKPYASKLGKAGRHS